MENQQTLYVTVKTVHIYYLITFGVLIYLNINSANTHERASNSSLSTVQNLQYKIRVTSAVGKANLINPKWFF